MFTQVLRTQARTLSARSALLVKPTAAARRPINPVQLGRFASSLAPREDEPAPQIIPTPEEEAYDPQLAGLGYPQLPAVSRQLRPAKAGWWDEQERINFNEVLHESDDSLSMWAPDVHKTPGPRALAHLGIAAGTIALFTAMLYYYKPERPATQREYPYDGLVKELSGTEDQAYAAVVKSDGKGSDDDEEADDDE